MSKCAFLCLFVIFSSLIFFKLVCVLCVFCVFFAKSSKLLLLCVFFSSSSNCFLVHFPPCVFVMFFVLPDHQFFSSSMCECPFLFFSLFIFCQPFFLLILFSFLVFFSYWQSCCSTSFLVLSSKFCSLVSRRCSCGGQSFGPFFIPFYTKLHKTHASVIVWKLQQCSIITLEEKKT